MSKLWKWILSLSALALGIAILISSTGCVTLDQLKVWKDKVEPLIKPEPVGPAAVSEALPFDWSSVTFHSVSEDYSKWPITYDVTAYDPRRVSWDLAGAEPAWSGVPINRGVCIGTIHLIMQDDDGNWHSCPTEWFMAGQRSQRGIIYQSNRDGKNLWPSPFKNKKVEKGQHLGIVWTSLNWLNKHSATKGRSRVVMFTFGE